MGVSNCFMFCCTLLYVHSSFAIIFMGKREMVALLSLSSWCMVDVRWRFLAMPWVCLQFVIVVFPDHTHLLFCIVLILVQVHISRLSKCFYQFQKCNFEIMEVVWLSFLNFRVRFKYV